MTEQPRQPTEEELRAAYEEQLSQIRVDDVLVQTVLSLINLGGLRAGLVPGKEVERDLDELRQAIDGVRALLPLVEPGLGRDAAQVRDALSRLQMEYARQAGADAPVAGGQPGEPEAAPPKPGEPEAPPPKPGEPGPAERSGKLWVPGR